jgi:hypothetical protein
MGATPNPLATPAPFVPVPIATVHFNVEVDRARCATTSPAIDARLLALEAGGLTMTIVEIVVRAGMHFAGAVMDRGEGFEVAQIRKAWDFLMDWNLRAEAHAFTADRIVLVVDEQENARLSATRSEILAFGIGLEVASRIYDIEYALWEGSPGLSLHDIQTYTAAGGLIEVELRGRINRKGMTSAVEEIYEKFATGNFSNAAGVVVFPRTTNGSRSAEIMIVDPDGDRPTDPASSRLRILLRHYAPFFYYQGGVVRRFGVRMREISLSDEPAFANYLANGDGVLIQNKTRAGRVGFTESGVRYVGTVWDGVYWPDWLTGIKSPAEGGVFFWGLRKGIVDAIRSGKLAELVGLREQHKVISSERHLVVILEDGICLIWAASEADLGTRTA